MGVQYCTAIQQGACDCLCPSVSLGSSIWDSARLRALAVSARQWCRPRTRLQRHGISNWGLGIFMFFFTTFDFVRLNSFCGHIPTNPKIQFLAE